MKTFPAELIVLEHEVQITLSPRYALLALRRRLAFSRADVVAVRHDSTVAQEARAFWKGVRIGTHVPGVATLGTYWKRSRRPTFWCVRWPEHAVAFELGEGSFYERVVVDVPDPVGLTIAVGKSGEERL